MRFTFVHAADLHLDAVPPPLPEGGGVAPPGIRAGSGPGNRPGDSFDAAGLLRAAPFTALRRLVDLCLESGAAFLLLSGDVFDGRGGSLKARLELRDAVEKLGARNIQVFWARGNHDPLEAEGDPNADAVIWPGNLKIFSTSGSGFLLRWEDGVPGASVSPVSPGAPDSTAVPPDRSGSASARDISGGAVLIHGISHRNSRVRENLASRLQELARESAVYIRERVFQIGVLHCAVGGSSSGHESYAPCSPGDLTDAPGGPDYWALGHIHVPAALSGHPYAAYPGSLQGLHVKESGPHGCILATVNGNSLERASFVPLAPVRWERFTLDLSDKNRFGRAGGATKPGQPADFNCEDSGPLDLADLEDFILSQLMERAVNLPQIAAGFEPGPEVPEAELARAPGRAPQLLLFRLELRGRTPFDALLRREGSLEDLLPRLNAALAERDGGLSGEPESLACALRIKDIRLNTSPDVDLEALLAGDNLVSETIRCAFRLREQALAADFAGPSGLISNGSASNGLGLNAVAPGAPGELFNGNDEGLLEFCRNALDGLYQHAQIRKLRALQTGEGSGGEGFLELDGASLVAMAEEAAAICLELFEVDE